MSTFSPGIAAPLATPLTRFIDAMDETVERESSPPCIARAAAGHLQELLGETDVLPDAYRVPAAANYCQHLIHVHERGLYSLVSLVWNPDQETPIHDHRCWCVVGVLKGREEETRYHLVSDGSEQWLVPVGTVFAQSGSVGVLVPPAENIHRVANGGDSLAISLHVYGADIRACGTSINHVFDLAVREGDETGAPVAWRGETG